MFDFSWFNIFLLVFSIFLYTLFSKPRYSRQPPHCAGWTRFGPSQLFLNPSTFTSEMRKTLKSEIFSCDFFFHRLTFVFGKEYVEKITTSDNHLLNFESSYAPFLSTAFGYGMLNHQTVGPQVEVLKKYLTSKHLQVFVAKSSELIDNFYRSKLGSSGECDLQPLLQEITFQAGARNFLGDQFLAALPNYDYNSIFSGFEIGLRILIQFCPSFIVELKNAYERRKGRTYFEEVVLKLASIPITDPQNMLEEIIFRHSQEKGPTQKDDKILTNLVKLFVFGSSFNNYNVICFVVRELVKNNLWSKLREEQAQLQITLPFTQEKISSLKLLNQEIQRIGCENAFPFLLRKVQEDFPLGDFVIPAGDLIAFSPRITENPQQNLIFGSGLHACPAKKYALNSIATIIGILINQYEIVAKEEIIDSENQRLITFSAQGPIPVSYLRKPLSTTDKQEPVQIVHSLLG